MEADGFQLVKKNKKGRRTKPPHPCAASSSKPDASVPMDDVDVEAFMKKLQDCRLSLQGSDYMAKVKDILLATGIVRSASPTQGDPQTASCQEIVCYGLGNFSCCATARHQLAFLLALKELLTLKAPQCLVYDPQFTRQEQDLLETKLQCTVIPRNEEGKRPCTRPTLYYMPHCGKALYNNLLWANWSPGKLRQLNIMGNSFTQMQDSIPDSLLKSKLSYLFHILPHIEESVLPNIYPDATVFNDTSLHTFTEEKLKHVVDDVWNLNTEPVYDETDAEIIMN